MKVSVNYVVSAIAITAVASKPIAQEVPTVLTQENNPPSHFGGNFKYLKDCYNDNYYCKNVPFKADGVFPNTCIRNRVEDCNKRFKKEVGAGIEGEYLQKQFIMRISGNHVLAAIAVAAFHVGDSIAQTTLAGYPQNELPTAYRDYLNRAFLSRNDPVSQCYRGIICTDELNPAGGPLNKCEKNAIDDCNARFNCTPPSWTGPPEGGCEPVYQHIYSCNDKCPVFEENVCGCDRILYSNSCLMDHAQCDKPEANIVPTSCGCKPSS